MNFMVASSTMQEFFKDMWVKYQDSIFRYGKTMLTIIVVLIIGWVVAGVICRMIGRSARKVNKLDESLVKILKTVARSIVWVVVFLIVLDLIGINTASILTVLGAVGLAVALAMKDSLSNIAAGLMIITLRPYKTGDYVDCGDVSGTIKEMGLFSTELTTVDGLFVAVPNSLIFGSPVKNYSRNALRRGDIAVSIARTDSLTEAVKALQDMLAINELVLKDPAAEVLVSQLADSTVELNVRFWVKSENYWDAYWQIKSALKPALESAGMQIPFPRSVVTVINQEK